MSRRLACLTRLSSLAFSGARVDTSVTAPLARLALATSSHAAEHSGLSSRLQSSLTPASVRALNAGGRRGFHAASAARDAAKVPAPHPGLKAVQATQHDYCFTTQPIYKEEDLDIVPTEREVKTLRDRFAYALVSIARYVFDKGTGYGPNMTEAKWLNRFIFLETVAAIPGMVGGAARHLHSLRLMKRDNGWIHTLLEEAENERMHLLTFITLKQPGVLFRSGVLIAQGVLYNVLFASYLLSPKTVHRFVGHLEEQAVKTYTHAISDIDAGRLPEWSSLPAPEIAMKYWQLKDGAVMRDLLLAVRADEACHAHVNHTLASLPSDATNPFRVGHTELPKVFVNPPEGIDMSTGRRQPVAPMAAAAPL